MFNKEIGNGILVSFIILYSFFIKSISLFSIPNILLSLVLLMMLWSFKGGVGFSRLMLLILLFLLVSLWSERFVSWNQKYRPLCLL